MIYFHADVWRCHAGRYLEVQWVAWVVMETGFGGRAPVLTRVDPETDWPMQRLSLS